MITTIFVAARFLCKTDSADDILVRVSEIDYRHDKIVNRIAEGDVLRITRDILLAGLTHDPALKHRVTNYSGKQTKINLGYPIQFSDELTEFDIVKLKTSRPDYSINITSFEENNARLAIWNLCCSSCTEITLKGGEAVFTGKERCFVIKDNLKEGDVIGWTLNPVLSLIDSDRNEIDIAGITTSPAKTVMIKGPWLMTVDDVFHNLFMMELSDYNIIIFT